MLGRDVAPIGGHSLILTRWSRGYSDDHEGGASPAIATGRWRRLWSCAAPTDFLRQQQTFDQHELLIADPLALWTIGRKELRQKLNSPRSVLTRILGLAGAHHLIRKIVIVLRVEQVTTGRVGRLGRPDRFRAPSQRGHPDQCRQLHPRGGPMPSVD